MLSVHRNFFGLLFSAALLLMVLEFIGVYFDLFWRTVWFDIPLHMLGGLIIAFGLFAFLSYFRHHHALFSDRVFLIFLVGATLAVGLLWECYELLTSTTALGDRYYFLDTAKDLADDVIGSLGARYFLIREYGSTFL